VVDKERRRPQRTCLGCGERDEQKKLIRLALTKQGRLTVNKDQGRGGYLHDRPDCWQGFLRRKGQYRAFHMEIGRAVKEELITELKSRYRE
jgi:uncharacterized protein